MTNAELVKTIDALYEKATKGPWAWDQRGEKTNEWGLGVAFDKDDKPLSGRFDDDDAQYVEYVCSHERATCNYADPELICTLVNAWPQIRAHLAEGSVRVPRKLLEDLLSVAEETEARWPNDMQFSAPCDEARELLSAAPGREHG